MYHGDYIHTDLRDALQSAWDVDTAYPACREDYHSKDPSWGNCLVSALVIREVQGGKVLFGEVDTPSEKGLWHARNHLDGWGYATQDIEVDSTWQQFEDGAVFHPGYDGRQQQIIHESVFKDDTLIPRLELLLQRMDDKAGYKIEKTAAEIVDDLRRDYSAYSRPPSPKLSKGLGAPRP